MSAGKPGNASTSEAPANGQTELAEQATEGMLGPNPFVGLRAEDIVASLRAIGEQAIQHPTLVVRAGSDPDPRFDLGNVRPVRTCPAEG